LIFIGLISKESTRRVGGFELTPIRGISMPFSFIIVTELQWFVFICFQNYALISIANS